MATVADPRTCSNVGPETTEGNGEVGSHLDPAGRVLTIGRFFCNLSISAPVQRNNYFMQVDDTLFQQEPFATSLPSPPKIQDIRIRHERQTLRRLPRSNAVLFMVRTYLTPVVDLEKEKDNLFAFREAIRAWPPQMAKYKARDVWGSVLEDWCDEILGDHSTEKDMYCR